MPAKRPTPPLSSRAAIVDLIRTSGQISRVELTQATGLTPATVSTVVRKLIDDELVLEGGRVDTGGKPRTLLEIRPDARYAVGVQLGPDGASYVVADFAGSVIARWRRPGVPLEDQPDAAVQRAESEIRALLRRIDIPTERLIGVGVVAPGPLLTEDGRVLAPPGMSQWRDFPLRSRLSAALGRPVLLGNDATASVVGAHRARGFDADVMATLFMAEGIGAGLWLDGQVFDGAHGNAGEVGHVTVALDGPECWCGNHGCLEALGGPAVVVAKARAAGLDLGAETPTRSIVHHFNAVARLAVRGEPTAVALLHESARYVTLGALALANLIDLELLVLTGPSFTVAGPLYLPVIRERLGSSFFARGGGDVRVELDTSGNEAAAVGAATMSLRAADDR